jgi:hypothetical protein
MADQDTNTARLQTLRTVPGTDDLCTRYVVRTAWFAEGTDTVLEHEETFTNRPEAQAWMDCTA